MKNIVRFPFVLICTATVFLSSPVAPGSITVDEAKIRSYLTTWLDQEEEFLGHPAIADKDEFLKKYTDGTSTLPDDYSIKLIDVAKLHISFVEGSATLTFKDACDMTDQLWIDVSVYEQDTIYEHFKKLDAAGKKYCNMFHYLTCKDDTTVAPSTHRCQCPSGMLWDGGKCVIKSGEICSGVTDTYADITYVDGHSYAIFNFVSKKYEIDIPHPTCEDKNRCADDRCEPDQYHAYHSTPKEIAAFLKKHADADPQYVGEEGLKSELIRHAMRDITSKYRGFERLALSMELRAEPLLREYGQTCDHARDSPLDAVMKTYNSRESGDFRNKKLGHDMMRISFQKSVIDAGSTPVICNHFKILRCNPAGICDCKENFVWNAGSKSCTTKNNYVCSWAQFSLGEVKLFSLESTHSGSLDDMYIVDEDGYYVPNTLSFRITYFKYMNLECETGTKCEYLGFINTLQWTCLAPGEHMTLMKWREDFDKKLSIPLNDDCSASDHTALFNTNTDLNSFLEIRKTIETLVASPVKYCRLMEFATCSNSGKCTCVPPTIASGTACTASPYAECEKFKSDVHKELDKLILPLTTGIESAASDIFCPPNFECIQDRVFTRRVCTCEDMSTLKFGDKCNIEPHLHVDHLDVEYLPDSMRTPEGRKLISDLHEAMTILAGTETIDYSQACEEQDLDTVRSFLAKVRDDCKCYLHGSFYNPDESPWRCNTGCRSNPDFERSNFEVVVQNVKNLVVKAHPICQRTRNVQCLSGICQCPEDFFYEKEECRADLGTEDLCSHGRRNIPDSGIHCREGAMCNYPKRCQSTNPIITDAKIYWEHDESARSYVTKVKEKFKKYIMDHRDSLHLLRSLQDGHTCNHEMESRFEIILAEYNPILDSLKDGDTRHDRGDIRRMEPVASSIRSMTNQPKAKFCREVLRCSPVTNKCERQKKPYTPYYASSPRVHLNQGLMTILLVFIGVSFGI